MVVYIEKKHRKCLKLDATLKGATGMLLGKAPNKKGWAVLLLSSMEVGYFSNVVVIE